MRQARDIRVDLSVHYKYDEVKKQERKKTKEFRNKRKNKHGLFVTNEDY
jgi:hypothetical protein